MSRHKTVHKRFKELYKERGDTTAFEDVVFELMTMQVDLLTQLLDRLDDRDTELGRGPPW